MSKPPIAPTSNNQTGTLLQPQMGMATASAVTMSKTNKTGRTPMAYGGQRSATTSIMQVTTGQQQQQPSSQSRTTTMNKQSTKQAHLPNGHGNNKYILC